MKKITSILLIGLMVFSLLGCNKKDDANVDKAKSDSTGIEQQTLEKSPVAIEDLPLNFIIQDDNTYLTYKNNSDKTIKSIQIVASVKGSDKKTYFNGIDSIEAGQTSPKLEADGPKATNKEDIEIDRYFITFIDKDGAEKNLRYSCLTKKYILTSKK